MRIVDLQLNIDGIILNGDESIEDYIKAIQSVTNSTYQIQYQILHEEII